MTTETKLHPFEAAGLGRAPFTVAGWHRSVGPIRIGNMEIGSPGQPMGVCDYCGTGIAICVTIASHDGKKFIVGCDCVKKCDDSTNTLSTAVDRIRAEIAKQQREEKNEQRRAAREAKREIELNNQRAANGGLTDRELAQKTAAEQAAKQAAIATVANQWLIDTLNQVPYESDFISSIIRDLRNHPITSLSSRALNILADIYAKQHGRRGSKAYNAALDTFEAKTGRNENDT